VGKDVKERWFDCFEAIERRGGCGLRADFLAVGGSEANAEGLIQSMLEANLIEETTKEGKTCYAKTREGVICHLLLHYRGGMGSFFENVGRKNLKKKGEGAE
jgi:hypothetical protein